MAGSIFVFTNHVANIFCSVEGQISNYWIIIIGVITYISIIRRGGGAWILSFPQQLYQFLIARSNGSKNNGGEEPPRNVSNITELPTTLPTVGVPPVIEKALGVVAVIAVPAEHRKI